MSSQSTANISLEQAKLLVEYLESNQIEKANELIADIQNPINTELFAEIGKLTRQLHDSMNNFQVDSRLTDLAKADIPDAKERLNYVIERTEEAANKTMDAVESIFPVIESVQDRVTALKPSWNKLIKNELALPEFKRLCHDIDALLRTAEADNSKIRGLMTEVLMAQDFQDLTGQVIRKVIDLVKDVEDGLIGMLTAFGMSSDLSQNKAMRSLGENLVEGPIVNSKERDDVVSDQDDVDDLLSSLGF